MFFFVCNLASFIMILSSSILQHLSVVEFHFIFENYSIVEFHHHLFICSPVNGYFRCLQFLAIKIHNAVKKKKKRNQTDLVWYQLYHLMGFPGGTVANAGDARDWLVRKILWSRKMATCSSILAWKIPWTEEPGIRSLAGYCPCDRKVGPDWACRHSTT